MGNIAKSLRVSAKLIGIMYTGWPAKRLPAPPGPFTSDSKKMGLHNCNVEKTGKHKKIAFAKN